jgi:hypothetical protein
MNFQNIIITKVKPSKGSNVTAWNFDLDEVPFGQVWTFKNTATETHKFHAKPLTGAHDCFDTYAQAEEYMRGKM